MLCILGSEVGVIFDSFGGGMLLVLTIWFDRTSLSLSSRGRGRGKDFQLLSTANCGEILRFLSRPQTTLHPSLLHRASPFALYLRSTTMSLSKMSFEEAVAWWDSFERWSQGEPVLNPEPPSNRAEAASS